MKDVWKRSLERPIENYDMRNFMKYDLTDGTPRILSLKVFTHKYK